MNRARIAIMSIAVLMVLSACGGSGGDTSESTTSTAPGEGGGTVTSTTPASSSGGGQSETTTSTAADSDPSAGSNPDHPRTDVSHATVVVGDQVFLFAQVDADGNFDENGDCDPEFFGVQFRAILARVDEQGNRIVLEDTGNGLLYQGATFGFTDAGPQEGFVEMPDFWSANTAAGTGWVDTVTIDGNRAAGTASFVVGDAAETTDGTFEVTCVN